MAVRIGVKINRVMIDTRLDTVMLIVLVMAFVGRETMLLQRTATRLPTARTIVTAAAH